MIKGFPQLSLLCPLFYIHIQYMGIFIVDINISKHICKYIYRCVGYSIYILLHISLILYLLYICLQILCIYRYRSIYNWEIYVFISRNTFNVSLFYIYTWMMMYMYILCVSCDHTHTHIHTTYLQLY